jgi:hypothetical protein
VVPDHPNPVLWERQAVQRQVAQAERLLAVRAAGIRLTVAKASATMRIVIYFSRGCRFLIS